ILFAFLLCTISRGAAQPPARILWARGRGASDGYLSVLYSPYTRTVAAVTALGEGQNWPVGIVSLPTRTSLKGTPFCSVLSDGGRSAILGMSDEEVYEWDLTNN